MDKTSIFFANPDKPGHVMRSIVALGIVCMLLFAVVGCEASKEASAYDEMDEECVEERKYECDFDDDDFDLSELTEENCVPRWAVELTLKQGIADCPIENPVIKALIAKHDVTFFQSYPGFQTPELLLLYTLGGDDCSNLCHVKLIIRAFLRTGLFEYHVRVFGEPVEPLTSTN